MYFSRAIRCFNSWANDVVAVPGVMLESSKYSPGRVRGAPNTSSAGEQLRSAFNVFLQARRIKGRSSTQFVLSVMADREVFSDR